MKDEVLRCITQHALIYKWIPGTGSIWNCQSSGYWRSFLLISGRIWNPSRSWQPSFLKISETLPPRFLRYYWIQKNRAIKTGEDGMCQELSTPRVKNRSLLTSELKDCLIQSSMIKQFLLLISQNGLHFPKLFEDYIKILCAQKELFIRIPGNSQNLT